MSLYATLMLIEQRRQAEKESDRALQKGEAVLLLAREQGREKLEPEEDGEFRKYMKDAAVLLSAVASIDKRLNEIRAANERQNNGLKVRVEITPPDAGRELIKSTRERARIGRAKPPQRRP